MPFLWGTFLKQHGSIVGDQQAGSVMKLGNAIASAIRAMPS